MTPEEHAQMAFDEILELCINVLALKSLGYTEARKKREVGIAFIASVIRGHEAEVREDERRRCCEMPRHEPAYNRSINNELYS